MNSRLSWAWTVAMLWAICSMVESGWAAERVDPSGTWTWVRELEGQEAQSVLTLSYKDGKLIGSYKRQGQGQVVPISNAKFEKNELSFDADGKWNDQKVHGKFKGKLSGDAINGTIEIVVEDGSLPLAWIARRGVDVDDLMGTWKLKFVTPDGGTIEPQLKLSVEGRSLKGTYTSTRFGEHEAKELKLNGQDLSWMVEFERNGQKFKGVYKGKLEVGAAKGTIKGTLAIESAGKTTALEFSGEHAPSKTVGGHNASNAKNANQPGNGPNAPAKPLNGKSANVSPVKRRVIVMLKSRRAILVVYSSAANERNPVFSIRSTRKGNRQRNLAKRSASQVSADL